MPTAKFKKYSITALVFVAIFAAGILAGKCAAWLSGPDKQIIYEAQLNGALKALKTANKYGVEYVYMKELTNFEWDKVCVITSYILPKTIKQRAGVEYYDFTAHDGQWGLLFIDKNKKLIPIRIDIVPTVYLAIGYSDAKKYKFEVEGAVYCANKDNAKLVFHFDKIFGEMAVTLVSQ